MLLHASLLFFAELTNIDPVLVFGFIEGDDEDEDDTGGGCTELADDLNRDLPQGDDMSMVGDPMLYGELSASSYGLDSSVYSSDTSMITHTHLALEHATHTDCCGHLVLQCR